MVETEILSLLVLCSRLCLGEHRLSKSSFVAFSYPRGRSVIYGSRIYCLPGRNVPSGGSHRIDDDQLRANGFSAMAAGFGFFVERDDRSEF